MRTAGRGSSRSRDVRLDSRTLRSLKFRVSGLALSAALASSGCVTLPPPPLDPPAAAAETKKTNGAKPASAPELRSDVRSASQPAKPGPKIAAIDPQSLFGMSPEAVNGLFGTPDQVVKKSMSLEWTYSNAACSLYILFYPNIRTSAFRVLKYGTKDSKGGPDDARKCIQQIRMASANGPG